jgi:hypothetical protein
MHKKNFDSLLIVLLFSAAMALFGAFVDKGPDAHLGIKKHLEQRMNAIDNQ